MTEAGGQKRDGKKGVSRKVAKAQRETEVRGQRSDVRGRRAEGRKGTGSMKKKGLSQSTQGTQRRD